MAAAPDVDAATVRQIGVDVEAVVELAATTRTQATAIIEKADAVGDSGPLSWAAGHRQRNELGAAVVASTELIGDGNKGSGGRHLNI